MIRFNFSEEDFLNIDDSEEEGRRGLLIKEHLKTKGFSECLAIPEEGLYINLSKVTYVQYVKAVEPPTREAPTSWEY